MFHSDVSLKVLVSKYSTTNYTELSDRSSAIRAAYRNVLGATEACACYANGLMPKPH
ncbi:hypothetical protein N644_2544 [Lactiplantibacillus paraplantarum]|nr:hypothetical protein N644_2544 [Lactiplantibacillus paraplantarum]